MSYIPLDDDLRQKGKAAVDVVGARLGKSGGALMQQIMFAFIGPISVIAPFVAIIFIAILITWLFAVGALSKRFHKLSNEQSQ